MLTLTITGLFIATLVSVLSILIDKEKAIKLKILFIVLILSGFGIATNNSLIVDKEKGALKKDKQEAEKKADLAQQKLNDLKKMMDLINVTLGNLATLDQLSGNDKYYVHIAGSRDINDLLEYKTRIYNMFSGADSSGMVGIKESLIGGRPYYELVFGQNLDVAAAEVFQRLAENHRFCKEDDFPRISKEK